MQWSLHLTSLFNLHEQISMELTCSPILTYMSTLSTFLEDGVPVGRYRILLWTVFVSEVSFTLLFTIFQQYHDTRNGLYTLWEAQRGLTNALTTRVHYCHSKQCASALACNRKKSKLPQKMLERKLCFSLLEKQELVCHKTNALYARCLFLEHVQVVL